MSNIYITEPGTEGKVLLHTTFGDIDVELWPQQAPKACRNFVQLCLEGYYDNTIFHRIIAGFMVQGGDPTGTGSGGESIYGGPFADEFHSRLRFNHRGLVAMANANTPNSNHSQFFFTLDACEFLDRKHTIFGKITGNTIFNLLPVGDTETDAQDRPLHPPKLLSVEVLWNPFDDIVPRDIQHAHQRTAASAAADAASTKKRARKATRDLKLLSFGDEEQAFEQTARAGKRSKKLLSSHALLDDKKLKAHADAQLLEKIAASTAASSTRDAPGGGGSATVAADATGAAKKEAARASLKAAVAAAAARAASAATTEEAAVDAAISAETPASSSSSAADAAARARKEKKRAAAADQDEYTRLREELRASKKAAPVALGSKSSDAAAADDTLTPLQQQRLKYLQKKRAHSRSGRQEATLQKLAQFRATLEGAKQSIVDAGQHDGDKGGRKREVYHGQVLHDSDDSDSDAERTDSAADRPRDLSWMTAKLKFQKHIDDQFRAGNDPSIDNYVTVDTRTERGRGSDRVVSGGGDARRRVRSRSRERGGGHDRNRSRRR